MKTVTKSIIQKVKDQLAISDDLSATELYDLLHKYRSSQHPDKYLDENFKKEAEERFKQLNLLLDELGNFIEKEKLQKKPSELILFEKDFEIIKTKQEILRFEKEIENLRLNIQIKDIETNNLKAEIKNLKTDLARATSDKVDKKTNDLIELYKPTKRSLLSLGLTFLLTIIIGVLTKIDQIALILKKYSPLQPIILNTLIFIFLIGIPLMYIKMIYEEHRIENAAKRIKTPKFILGFLIYLKENSLYSSFTEMDVYNYLTQTLISRRPIVRYLYANVISIYNETTIDSLKDIFIFNLLNKRLIAISNADRLDRNFDIIRKTSFNINTDNMDLPF
jgi:hypothetical protein